MKTAESAMPLKLSRGRHADPSDGACLMELASLLAGEAWSDHPVCVHPVLAAVARGVNDKIGDEDRARLAPLVPYMIGTATDDPRSSARLLLLCAGAALARPDVQDHLDICCQMEAARRVAKSVLSGTRECSGRPISDGLRMTTIAVLASCRVLRRFYLRQAATHAALAVATMATAEAGEDAVTLCELLESCVACCPKVLDQVSQDGISARTVGQPSGLSSVAGSGTEALFGADGKKILAGHEQVLRAAYGELPGRRAAGLRRMAVPSVGRPVAGPAGRTVVPRAGRAAGALRGRPWRRERARGRRRVRFGTPWQRTPASNCSTSSGRLSRSRADSRPW